MKYFILHGSFGSKDGNWFPWLKEKLEEKGEEVILPQMPVGVGKQIIIHNGGHLNAESGYMKFDELLKI